MIIEPNNCYCVYIHITPCNKVYIGITKNIKNRFSAKGEYYRNCNVFYKAIKKWGWDNIKHEVLFENLTKEEAEQKEIQMIAFYKSNDRRYGYNILKGGNISTNDSIERREKISKSLKKYNATHPLKLKERIKSELEKQNALSLKSLKVNGNDLIEQNIAFGKKIGEVLNHLLECVIEDPELNDKEKLLRIARSYVN